MTGFSPKVLLTVRHYFWRIGVLAIFTEYAQSDSWVAVHLAQWFAVLLIIGGLVALYYSITTKPEAAAAVARFGFAAALLTGASLTMLQAVDGVALKWAVDT